MLGIANQSAMRQMVPKFPGSWMLSSTRCIFGCIGVVVGLSWVGLYLMSASTWLGVTRLEMDWSSGSVISMICSGLRKWSLVWFSDSHVGSA